MLINSIKERNKMSKANYKITGNTFDLKGKIKKAGGKYDGANKCWTAELYSSDSIFRYEGQLTFTKIEDNQEFTDAEKEQEYDNLHNEGAEGFNPYR